MLTKDFFINNRKSLAKKVADSSVIVIAGNGLVQKSADNNYSFYQDSNFYYLTGLNEPNSFIILDLPNKQEYFCYLKKSKIEVLFDGDYDFEHIAKTSGIYKFIEFSQAFKLLKSIYNNQAVYFNINKPQSNLYNNPHNLHINKKLHLRSIKTLDISPILTELRSIKQKEELAIMSQAIKHTKTAIDLAVSDLQSVNSESKIANVINSYFANNGIKNAYEPMVAAGKSATTAHYSKNNRPFNDSDVLLLDIGAQINHYCADISRTFTKNNKVIDGLILELTEVQRQLISLVKPGIFFKDIQLKAIDLIGDILINNHFIKNKTETTNYFMYAIGHFLGLDVHDVGDYKKPLQQNMVITIEPGIHIPDKNIGIRIEDDILITNDGARVL